MTLNQNFVNAQNKMITNINQIAASVEQIKTTSKRVIAFRTTCAEEFPNTSEGFGRKNPGKLSQFSFFANILRKYLQ